VRNMAAAALGRIGDPRAIEPLFEVLKNDDQQGVAQFACSALMGFGPLDNLSGAQSLVVEPLIAALKDESARVRSYAAYIFYYIGCSRLGDEVKARAVEPLVEALEEGDENVRGAAIKVLGELGDSRAVEPLVETLEDEDGNMRDMAASALGELGDSRAVEPLIEALKGENKRVSERAAEALGELGDSRAVEPLIEALKGENKRVSMVAARALGKLDPLYFSTIYGSSRNIRDIVRDLGLIKKAFKKIQTKFLRKDPVLETVEYGNE